MLHTGVGGINESDVTLAKASNAMMVGFNVRANAQARQLAEAEGLDIRYYAIIYNLVDDLKSMLTGMLAPQIRETFLGNAAIKEVFNITKVGRVAGCEVTEGVVRRGSGVRLLRMMSLFTKVRCPRSSVSRMKFARLLRALNAEWGLKIIRTLRLEM